MAGGAASSSPTTFAPSAEDKPAKPQRDPYAWVGGARKKNVTRSSGDMSQLLSGARTPTSPNQTVTPPRNPWGIPWPGFK